ncbi:MAG: flagellar hook assembly protein FlgD [Leptospirillum sp.]|jgi:flagellar basal-body rod modification protein FlgD
MIINSKSSNIDEIRKMSEKRLAPKSPPPPTKKLGMGDFLHLMISQLQYQDPMHPLNNTKFAAQLAQFSQLDQLTRLNKGVGAIGKDTGDANKIGMVGFLGQEVTVSGNGFHFDAKDSARMTFTLDGAIVSGAVRVFDASHHLVRTLSMKPALAGTHSIEWDGVTNHGSMAAPGNYSFEVEAKDGRHRPVSANPVETGVVTGVLFKDGAPILEVGGREIALKDVSHVGKPPGHKIQPSPGGQPALPVAPKLASVQPVKSPEGHIPPSASPPVPTGRGPAQGISVNKKA